MWVYNFRKQCYIVYSLRGRQDRDRMIDGFTTFYAINAYHH